MSADMRLVGATLERVYWAMKTPVWLPVIGKEFDSYQKARRAAWDKLTEAGVSVFDDVRNRAEVETRMVVRRVDGVVEDMPIHSEIVRLTV